MRFRRALLTVLILVFSQMVLAYEPSGEGGGHTPPWPWGTECPFPWNNIEGLWQQTEPKSEQFGHYYFEFEIIDQWSSGSHVFRVNQFNQRGEMVASGKAVSRRGHRIVKAILIPDKNSSEQTEPYMVIVRAYNPDKSTCSDKIVTVMTMRKRGAPVAEDIHMIIEKTPMNRD